ncbi:30S ribosomal protein S7, partial [bacterium]|nr:30S ribosomal protein S7 [bacterium]
MSRKSRADQRKVAPDPVYKNVLVSKFINGIMLDGKRSLAEHVFYGALDEIKSKSDKD